MSDKSAWRGGRIVEVTQGEQMSQGSWWRPTGLSLQGRCMLEGSLTSHWCFKKDTEKEHKVGWVASGSILRELREEMNMIKVQWILYTVPRTNKTKGKQTFRVPCLCFLKSLLDNSAPTVTTCPITVLINVKNLGDNEKRCIFAKY